MEIEFSKSLHVPGADGVSIATYTAGNPSLPTVLAVHGFASHAIMNWEQAGWVRALVRAGFRVLGIDQRGHGHSSAPHNPDSYSLDILSSDIESVLDAHRLERVHYLGYSLGSRVGWRLGTTSARDRIRTLTLGGMPLGDPLTTFALDQARRYIADGTQVTDRLTRAYLSMAEGPGGNDILALMSLVEGLRGDEQQSIDVVPTMPACVVVGEDDPIVSDSDIIASAVGITAVRLPGRNHISAVTARLFKDTVLEFLEQHRTS